VLVGAGIGIFITAILTLVLLSSASLLRPSFAGIYSALAIGGLIVAILGWFLLQE
jgi:hypothetical protein